MYQAILIPTDGSACSDKAASHGVALAKAVGAKLTFLHVLDPLPTGMPAEALSSASYLTKMLEDSRRYAEEALAKAQALAAGAGVEADTLLLEQTRPVDGIVKALGGRDLVVMGSHGRSGLGRLLLGSVTEGVMRLSDTPILVVRCARDD